jgi:signal-transduction protein with cAMP-binding, CBS, and nucleotidyltransferase domain
MKIVQDILRTKGNAAWSIHPDSTVHDALKLMAERNIGALLVMEEDHISGIFSERDYARKVILAGRSSLTTTVKEIMTEQVIFVRPEQSIEECMALMTQAHVRHLPVMEGSKLRGVISIGDVVKEIIADQDLEIQQLENYILGRGYSADPLQSRKSAV